MNDLLNLAVEAHRNYRRDMAGQKQARVPHQNLPRTGKCDNGRWRRLRVCSGNAAPCTGSGYGDGKQGMQTTAMPEVASRTKRYS